MTPYPATPLYDRLMAQGRLTRPKALARLPAIPHGLHAGAHHNRASRGRGPRREWTESYSPETTVRALKRIEGPAVPRARAVMFFTRLAFRGIYFPQMTKRHWIALLWQNRRSFVRILAEGYREHRRHRRWKRRQDRQGLGTKTQLRPSRGLSQTLRRRDRIPQRPIRPGTEPLANRAATTGCASVCIRS